ncbi:DNA-binding transcriptional regulator, AcrR family [Raineyella antarctica]|uniref:DNA-binding transcriptional regulator, AcrR family n=1 Tax=Raineyella antarctica TaxID=1577474 RepID=A0A1G6GFY9_9ACTN|nr:TetR/AcrR family transcriptional regulator [Raineyella antarctica]SDB80884.1 DNA-binding transcriptional regulator, AcrR family [Raineyella antarctica]
MGRPRQHDEKVAEALLDAAESRVAAEGVDSLSLRAVAAGADTTTRAVYTLFGSKDALVGALGVRAMRLLEAEALTMTPTADPAADLVEAGLGFRRFALGRPALFSVAFHRASAKAWPPFREVSVDTFSHLQQRFEPLAAQGLLGDRTIPEAALQFDALCEGLAWVELRGNRLTPDPETFWRRSIAALVAGFLQAA